ncbi:tRNA (adenosine(37)-N6)-dimethylallyltransferase MiaA [Sphingomonas mucosissima]|uniref:tRNA dimethylallyltransferase n=1 Tax=Sphingomonas mucosissima TaxID=370959 RepID=A0A245ZSB2_9SPHN|nr:tRNA (adenosine(37)-N6)-dimethylallyltransferase MiaA [Sphingomonas mucosissima]OWK32624.1 tRNA dimethylallyltransferase [Sphingomonas mucosissima]
MNKRVSLPKLALIAGPTASGKSSCALAVAQHTGGMIINADASQVYRDLRVITARPTIEDEAKAEHRLYGHVDGAAPYSAAQWADDARAAIHEVIAQGRLPILTGGTGLYMRTLLDGIAPVPPIDPEIREEVRALPVAQAHAALCIEDAVAARRLAPADSARVARALEVVRSTGRSLHEWQAERSGGIADQVSLVPLIILPDRAGLNARIEARLTTMFADGAVAEVKALFQRTEIPPSAPIRRAIGVEEIAAFLRGEIDEGEARARIALATRRYAKRQFTWFRHQFPGHWARVQTVDKPGIERIFQH